jgi:hypothetical protein
VHLARFRIQYRPSSRQSLKDYSIHMAYLSSMLRMLLGPRYHVFVPRVPQQCGAVGRREALGRGTSAYRCGTAASLPGQMLCRAVNRVRRAGFRAPLQMHSGGRRGPGRNRSDIAARTRWDTSRCFFAHATENEGPCYREPRHTFRQRNSKATAKTRACYSQSSSCGT